MTESPWSLFSPFSQTIGKFLYDPTTTWTRFFNPQVIFNYNPEDAPVEAHVLSKVGSYGSQLATLIGAIDSLHKRVDGQPLDDDAREALAAFDELRDRSREAVAEFDDKVGPSEILRAAKELAIRDPSAARALRAKLDAALAATLGEV